MAKKFNAKKEKRERARQERRAAAKAVRVTLIPEERHSQVVPAP